MELIKFVCWGILLLSTVITILALYDNISKNSIFKANQQLSDRRLEYERNTFNNQPVLWRIIAYIKLYL